MNRLKQIKKRMRKALKDPQHVTNYVIEDLIKSMDGEIIIRWNNRTEAKAF